jgi:hypothetical protein
VRAADYEFSVVCSNRIRATYGPDIDIWALADVGKETLKARGFRARDIKDIMRAAEEYPRTRQETVLPRVVWVWFASGGSLCFTTDEATAQAFGAAAYTPHPKD